MKRHLSVFELAARGAVYKTLLVSLTAAAAIFALLCAGLDGIDNLAGVLADDVHPDESANGLPGALIANMVYSAGILLLFILLSRSWAPKKGVNPDYTFRRLCVSEREAAYIQAGVHALCFVFYMAAALAAYLGFSAYFFSRPAPYGNDGQTLLFAAYKSLPLHTLLPLADWYEWLFAAATCLVGGVGSVALSFWKRRACTSGIGVCSAFALALTHFLRVSGSELHFVFVFLELALIFGGIFGSLRDNTAEEREAASAEVLEPHKGGGANAPA